MTHGPVESEDMSRTMNLIAHGLDQAFNGDGEGGIADPKRIGFVLLTFKFGQVSGGRINYLSNGARNDVHVALRELLARWEGRHPEEAGQHVPDQ